MIHFAHTARYVSGIGIISLCLSNIMLTSHIHEDAPPNGPPTIILSEDMILKEKKGVTFEVIDTPAGIHNIPLWNGVNNTELVVEGDVKPNLERRIIDSCRNLTFKEITIFNSCKKNIVNRGGIKSQIEKIKSDMISHGNGTVLIMPNALCLGSPIHLSDITITNQFSVEKFDRFLVQVQRWNGPASSALYIRDVQELLKFQTFILNHLESLRKVVFHIYFDNTQTKSAYPNNILRNIGLDNVMTNYFLQIDIDLFTAPAKTHVSLQSMLKANTELVDKLNEKTIFVLPAFQNKKIIPDIEMNAHHQSFPQNKIELLKMYENGEMKRFKFFHPKGHGPTNYTKWILDESDLSYPIAFKLLYEPYVIGARKSIPRFYNYFRGYGLNKYAWAAELHLAGYKYEVLRDYFVFHADHLSSYDMEEKKQHRWNNIRCAEYFLDQLDITYGDRASKMWKEWRKTNSYILNKDWLKKNSIKVTT